MIQLRDYQQKAVDDVKKALSTAERKRIICEMPTGGGKTVVFSHITLEAIKKNSNILILTDREELLNGTGGTLKNFGINTQYIRAGRKYAPDMQKGAVFVGMAQTLKRRLDQEKWINWFLRFDLIIIDECHKQEFNKFFEKAVFHCPVIGFSATPKRGGKQRQLGEDYDAIVHTLTTLELIERGYLMPDMYYGFEAPSMDGVGFDSKGDFSESGMFKKFDSPKVYSGAVESYKEHTPGTTAIVFCSNIIHSVRTAKEFCKAGIPAKFLSSKMSKPKRPNSEEPEDKKEASAEWVKYWKAKEYYDEYCEAYLDYSGARNEIIDKWRNSEFKVVCNAGILTTGFDFPAIQTVILLRATISEVLYLQMLGRGSRLCPAIGKYHFNILDFGGNAQRLGAYKLPRRWFLWHETKNGAGVPPMKECGYVNNELLVDKNGKKGCDSHIFASAKICPICGYVFPEKAEFKKIELSLSSVNSDGSVTGVKPIKEMTFKELDQFADKNRYSEAWLVQQLFTRGGDAEIMAYANYKPKSFGWVTQVKSRVPKHLIENRELAKTFN